MDYSICTEIPHTRCQSLWFPLVVFVRAKVPTRLKQVGIEIDIGVQRAPGLIALDIQLIN